jgi:hypothetical protein
MKKALLLIVFASAAFGQGAIPLPPDVDSAIAATVNFEGTITRGVSDLVTSVAPSIMPFGWTLLGLFGAYALLQSLLQGAMRQFASYHYHPLAIVTAYVAVLFRIAIAATMMGFYMVPMPGIGLNFHQIFPSLAQALASAVTTDLLKQVMGDMNDAAHFLPAVGMFQVLPGLLTVVVLGTIALAQVAMTIITAASYCIVGVLTCVGPLMIPFYVMPGHDKKFWNWFDNMLVYSMYVFVGACFIFVFCHSYVDFFANMKSYTVGSWLVSLPYMIIITAAFLWTMFKVPDISHMIFGGIGGVAQSFSNAIQSAAVFGVGRLLL